MGKKLPSRAGLTHDLPALLQRAAAVWEEALRDTQANHPERFAAAQEVFAEGRAKACLMIGFDPPSVRGVVFEASGKAHPLFDIAMVSEAPDAATPLAH